MRSTSRHVPVAMVTDCNAASNKGPWRFLVNAVMFGVKNTIDQPLLNTWFDVFNDVSTIQTIGMPYAANKSARTTGATFPDFRLLLMRQPPRGERSWRTPWPEQSPAAQ